MKRRIVNLMLRYGPLRDHIWRECKLARSEGWTAGLKQGVVGGREAAERKAARS